MSAEGSFTGTLQRIGPYRILSELGAGGMGVVYRGQHVETGLDAAIKTVRLGRVELLHGFRREVDALARLRHPGIVGIVEQGFDGGRPWYAMELLAGRSLRRYLNDLTDELVENDSDPDALTILPSTRPVADRRDTAAHRRRLSAEQTASLLTLARRLCVPLAFLHGEGLVHRDLKPDNVLVTPEGRAVIIDFGLATQFEGRLSLVIQQSESVAEGTVAYMAPELIAGEVVDARADLYAFGAILYELATGAPPFRGTVTEILQAHHTSAPRPIGDVVAGVPAQLGALVERLLAKHPRDRLGHADDVARVLESLGAQDPDASSAPAARPYLYRSGFAGRADALATLRTARSRDRGGLFLIGGESGSGKTRLCLESAREASRDGHLVLLGECLQEVAAPFEGLRKPLAAIADRCRSGGIDVTARIVGARGALLAPYVREFEQLPGHDTWPAVPPLTGREARHRVFVALAQTFAAIADAAPALVFIDDLQWADELTVGFFDFLATQLSLATVRLLLVGTYRLEETTDAIRALLARTDTDALTLAKLDDDAIEVMVGDMLALPPSPALCRHITRHSEGNPFFVAEYLHLAVERGFLIRSGDGQWRLRGGGDRDEAIDWASLPLPGSLRELVGRRLRDLPSEAATLLAAAAVIGRECEPWLLRRVAHLREDELLRATNELLRRHIVDEGSSGQLRFLHDKLREVGYTELPPSERSRLHAITAAAMEGRHEVVSDPQQRDTARDADAAVLAHHFRAAGATADAVLWGRRAATVAVRANAMAEAIEHLDGAIALLDAMTDSPEVLAARIGVRLELYRARFNHWSAADERLVSLHREAERIARTLGDEQRLVRAESGLALTLFPRAEYEEAQASCYRLLGRDYTRAPVELLRQMSPVVVGCLLQQGRFRQLCEVATIIADRLTGSPDPLAMAGFPYPPLVTVVGFLGYGAAATGRIAEGAAHNQRACDLARTSRSPYAMALADVMCAWSACLNGDAESALARSESATRLATDAHLAGPRLFALYTTGLGYALAGDAAMALRQLDRAEHTAEELGYLAFRSDLWYGRALARVAGGDTERAAEECAHGLAFGELTGERRWAVEFLRIAGECAEAKPVFSERCFAEASRVAEDQGAVLLGERARRAHARTGNQGGDHVR